MAFNFPAYMDRLFEAKLDDVFDNERPPGYMECPKCNGTGWEPHGAVDVSLCGKCDGIGWARYRTRDPIPTEP